MTNLLTIFVHGKETFVCFQDSYDFCNIKSFQVVEFGTVLGVTVNLALGSRLSDNKND